MLAEDATLFLPGPSPTDEDITWRPVLFATLPMLPLSGFDALKLGVMKFAGPIAASHWHLYVDIVLVPSPGDAAAHPPSSPGIIACPAMTARSIRSGIFLDSRSPGLDSADRDCDRAQYLAVAPYAYARSPQADRMRLADRRDSGSRIRLERFRFDSDGLFLFCCSAPLMT